MSYAVSLINFNVSAYIKMAIFINIFDIFGFLFERPIVYDPKIFLILFLWLGEDEFSKFKANLVNYK